MNYKKQITKEILRRFSYSKKSPIKTMTLHRNWYTIRNATTYFSMKHNIAVCSDFNGMERIFFSPVTSSILFRWHNQCICDCNIFFSISQWPTIQNSGTFHFSWEKFFQMHLFNFVFFALSRIKCFFCRNCHHIFNLKIIEIEWNGILPSNDLGIQGLPNAAQ